MESGGTVALVLGWVAAAAAIFKGLYRYRRKRKAEVGSQEVATADQMIDLVKKAFEEALTLTRNENKELRSEIEALRLENEENRKENEKLRRAVARLERAIRSISLCTYRDHCPIPLRLPDVENDDRKHEGAGGQCAHGRDSP